MPSSVIVAFILSLLVLTPGCEKSSESARRKLAELNIPYTHEAFWKAAENGDTLVVELFIEAGMNPDIKKGMDQSTALMLAASNGHTQTVEVLLNKGADVNAVTKSSQVTSLKMAVMSNHVETAKVLLARGADVHIKNDHGGTALKIAEISGYTEMIQLLKEAGAKE
jgi:ankyrin repeat protein